jgi:hypothetical protein
MADASFAVRRLAVSGIKSGPRLLDYKVLYLTCSLWLVACSLFAQEVKQPNVAGAFYPDTPQELSQKIDGFLDAANPQPVAGDIFALIVPHAGYDFSGPTAAYAYKLIKGKGYKTVVIIGPSHYYGFDGISVYADGVFHTPLGDVPVDAEFAHRLIGIGKDISFSAEAFQREHSVEVQIPFLQRTLTDFKIVPVVFGQVSFDACQNFAGRLASAIGKRKDVLVIASTDMYHGYDYKQAEATDRVTLSVLESMDAADLYAKLNNGTAQLCGGTAAVAAIITARELGHDKLKVLRYTDSAEVTGRKIKGVWTVGYASCIIDSPDSPSAVTAAGSGSNKQGGGAMLKTGERKRLLDIARNSLQTYLNTGKKLEVNESDPVLNNKNGAFVTLDKHGQLRGCIGNIVGKQPLYLTVRDMAVEAGVEDPRFPAVTAGELKDIEIEISVLSELKKIEDPLSIELGTHGVLVKRGFNSGVFLPQVATETGWSKEEFLSYLCSHKAGLSPDAWKDKATEIYVFTAEVFSEKDY